MSHAARHQTCILLAATILFFSGLGSTHLWDKDETLYGSCAREMFQRNDWVVPTFNDSLFSDKPPLMYWLMMTGFELFGVTEFAARFWSALLGVATALLTYHIGRLLFRPEVGLWAGLAVASNLIFMVSARAATVDSALTFFGTLGMLALIVGWRVSERSRTSCESDVAIPGAATAWMLPWHCLIWLYVTLGFGLLAKGPIGLVLPLATAGLFLLILSAQHRVANSGCARTFGRSLAQVCHPGNFLRTTWRMRPFTAAIVVLLIAAPWYVLVGLRTHGEWLQTFFIEQNVQRALQPFDSHGGSVFYYVVAISVGFFPWSVFLPGAVIQLVRHLRGGEKESASYLLLACWIGVYVVFWSAVGTKLPHYVLPAYPALAVMTAAFIHARFTSQAPWSQWWARYAVTWLLIIGVGMAVALPIVSRIYLPGEALLGLLGIFPIMAGIWCLVWFKRRRPQTALSGFALISIVFLFAMFTVAARRVDRHQTAPLILASLREKGGTSDLVAYGFMRESYVFYAGHAIPYCKNSAALKSQLVDRPRSRLLTTSDHLESIESSYPGRFKEVVRAPRFLKEGDVVVLAPVEVVDIRQRPLAGEERKHMTRLARRDTYGKESR
jgi:4-amino-4-deoxy-L-arabinose transferase-like glycosyltransferase